MKFFNYFIYSSSNFFKQLSKGRILLLFAFFLMICTFGALGVAPLSPDVVNVPVATITETLALPRLSDQTMMEEASQYYIYEEKIKGGDTLATLLNRLRVDDSSALDFIKTDEVARTLIHQKAGTVVRAQTNAEGELAWLQTLLPSQSDSDLTVTSLTIKRNPHQSAWEVIKAPVTVERRLEMQTADITHSLFAATDALNIPDAVAMQLVEMFSTDIDFNSDVRKGDHFEIVYESFWHNGERVGTGRILAGQFYNRGQVFQSVWFNEGDKSGYYTFDGRSNKKAFLKSPIAFTRISSGFSMRVHPISGHWKQHKGVDFAAPSGTPIRASADGVVFSIGRSGGYGNLVVLKHWSGYTTAYAHMSRFAKGLQKNARVKQGDIIGYVGATGWATGPHLHYEFRINHQAHDPMTVKVAHVQALSAQEMSRFKHALSDIKHRLALLRPPSQATQLAMVK